MSTRHGIAHSLCESLHGTNSSFDVKSVKSVSDLLPLCCFKWADLLQKMPPITSQRKCMWRTWTYLIRTAPTVWFGVYLVFTRTKRLIYVFHVFTWSTRFSRFFSVDSTAVEVSHEVDVQWYAGWMDFKITHSGKVARGHVLEQCRSIFVLLSMWFLIWYLTLGCLVFQFWAWSLILFCLLGL